WRLAAVRGPSSRKHRADGRSPIRDCETHRAVLVRRHADRTRRRWRRRGRRRIARGVHAVQRRDRARAVCALGTAAARGAITDVTPATDVERAIAIGRDLNAWWTDVEAGRASVERFVLAPGFPGGDAVRGFFGDAREGGATERYMGYSSDYFFDLAG